MVSGRPAAIDSPRAVHGCHQVANRGGAFRIEHGPEPLCRLSGRAFAIIDGDDGVSVWHGRTENSRTDGREALTTVDEACDVNSALRSLGPSRKPRFGTESGSGDCGGEEFATFCHARTSRSALLQV